MKTRRALSLVLVMAMILSMFTMVLPAGAAPGGTRTVSATRSRTSYTYYTDEQLMEMLSLSDMDELNALRSAAYDAAMYGTNWDLSAFSFDWYNAAHQDALCALIFEHPECFFIKSIGGSVYGDGTIAFLSPRYEVSYEVAMEQHAALESAAQEILCLFQRTELSDLELAVLVHDYLAANYEYHQPTLDLQPGEPGGKYSAYNLLVEGTAVCQGYAEAYAYLMMQFGINCGLCMSDTLDHAWNIIELDGKEYQLDVTWDDPTPNVYGKAKHSNMLLSTTAFKVSHVAEDFTGNPENTEFDTAFWQGINTPFCLVGDTIYFISTDQKLCSWDHTGSSDEIVELMDLSAKWYATGNSAWSGYYSCLATDGERLFYSTPSEIREYFPETNTSESVYAPEAKTDEGTGYKYNIFGFDFDGKDFRLNYYHNPNFKDDNIAESIHTYTFREETPDTHVYGDPVFTAFPCEAEGEARYDCIHCGFSKFETLPIAGHNWLPATCTDPITCSVCGEKQEGESGYILQDPTTYVPQNGDQIVIAVNNNGTYRAMSTGTSGRLDGADLAVVDGKIISDAPPVWIIETTEDGFALMTNGKYLTRGSSTNFSSSTNPYKWILTTETDGYQFTANTDDTRQVTYQISGNRFAPYSNTNTSGYIFTLQFFKYMEGGSALGHTKVTVPGTAATCTEDGLTDGSKCSVCGETITEQEVIPATGHTEEEVAGKDATCTEDGLTDGIKCSVCGETIQEQEVIPATGHTEKQVEGSEPTCTQPGMSAGIICATCGISLSDQEITPTLGHDEAYTPNNDGTHTITCSRCGLDETEDCTYTDDGVCEFCDYEKPVSEVGYEKATSITVGDTVILVCEAVSKEMAGFIQSTTYGDGADYTGAPTGVYPLVVEEGYTVGTYAFKTPDGKYFYHSGSKNTLSLNDSISENSSWTITFDSNGNAIITNCATTNRNIRWNKSDPRFATYTSAQTAVQLYKYVSGECQHPNAVVIEEKDPTCLEDGYKKWSCPDCGAEEVEPRPASPDYHVPGEVTTTTLLNPTCYYEGESEVIQHCSSCNGEISREYTTISMIPHSYEEGFCTMCDKDEPGKTFYLTSDPTTANRLVIYHPASGTALSLDASGEKLIPSKVTVEDGVLTTAEDTAVFDLQYWGWEEYPLYLMLRNGKYLTSGETGNKLFYGSDQNAYSQWKHIPVSAEDSTFQIMNCGAEYNGNKNQALEYYQELFTVYGLKDNDAAYYFQFYSDVEPECVHQWDDGMVTVEPKCNAEGTMVYTCTLCGETKDEVIPTVDHAWVAGATVEPTCTEDGYTPYTCPDCGAEKSDPIPATDHNYVAGTPVEPTCTEDGYTPYICSGCGAEEQKDSVPATGHSWIPATCIEPAYCENCDEIGGAFVRVNSLDELVDGSEIAIAVKVNGQYLTLTTTLNSGKFVPGEATGSKTHLLADKNLPVWTLGKDGDSFTLKADGGYLAYKSSTDFKFAEDVASWTISEGTDGFRITSASTTTRGILYFTDTGKFGAYATSNANKEGYYADLVIFKYVEGAVLPHYDNSIPMDNICDGCGCFITPAALITRSISLNGNIAVNFYMSLSDEVSSDENAYMLFSQEGKEDRKVYIKDCVEKQVRGKDAYIFSCEVSAKEMTDTITAQFFYGDGCSTEAYTYSVKTYADNQRANLSDNEALMNLLDAMLRYGAASQLQFDYHTERLADADLEKTDYTDVIIKDYPLDLPQGTDLVNFAGASLLLKSETTLRYFFQVDASVENLTITYNGTPLEILSRNGLYYVDVKNISAPDLDMSFTIIVNDGVQEAEVTYSPLTYCQSIRGKDTSTEILKDVCAALYLYNRAANAFFTPAE